MMTHLSHNVRGAAMLLFVLFFAFATSAMMFALGQSIFSDLSDFNRMTDAKQAFLVSEGLTEDVVYRRVFGTFDVDSVETLSFAGAHATSTTVYDSPADLFSIETEAVRGSTVRKTQAEMGLTGGSAFNYGLQAGVGGIQLSNSSSIVGNVYANGPVIGQGSATVYGDIISAGPTGLIQDIYATGSVRANTIDNIEADGDAYYNVALNMNPGDIAGTAYTPAVNQSTTTFPISTTTIEEWKDAIINYGTIISPSDPSCSSGTYTIDSSITIGFMKIECDLDVRSTGPGVTLTVDGPVWVEGDLSFTQGPVVRVHPSLGRRSVQFIVDNPADRITSSRIEIRNATDFLGSGDSRSYILLLSENESARLGGSDIALDVGQKADGAVVAYTNNGRVSIGNNIDLRSVTGYQLDISNGSSVTYETGLTSLLFTSGPGGGYTLTEWRQGK